MDSYSMMRFGNPSDYKQLGDVFKLYDNNGKEGCLTGIYRPAQGETLVREEPQLYFEHLVAPQMARVVNLPEDFRFYGSEVTYEGEIEASQSGDYQFILYYAGYTSVTIGGETVVPERWRTAWNPNAYKFTVHLEAGERTPLKGAISSFCRKPLKEKISITIDADILKELREKAEADDRSLSQYINLVLKKHLEDRKEK